MIDDDDTKSDKAVETEPAPVKETVNEDVVVRKTATVKAAGTETDKAVKKPLKNKRADSSGRRENDQVMPVLLKNLQDVFDKIRSDNTVRDRSHDDLAAQFTDNMHQAFLEMHKQTEDREHLLETRLESIDRMNASQFQRVKWLTVPIAFLSIIAVVYLFYVVRIMETSMSSMSGDMHLMTTYMETMQADTGALSVNTASMTQHIDSMNAQMGTLNSSVNNMMVDVHQLSRSVTPAMQGINRFMP